MLQPNLGLHSQHYLGSITETIQIFSFFSSYEKMWKVWRDKMEVGVWWGLEKESSISVFSASDCLEQTHLLCKRHWSSRVHLSVLPWHLCATCTDEDSRQLTGKNRHVPKWRTSCICIMCDISEHNSVSTFSVSPSNGTRLKRLKEVHGSPLLAYFRTALYYCSVLFKW